MIVIVEGIDRVGKTTLCTKLQERGFIYLKDGDYSSMIGADKREKAISSVSKLDTTFRFLEELNNQNVDVVVDRLHLTEMAYGTARKRTCFTDEIRMLETNYADKSNGDAILVLVEPTNLDEAEQRAGESMFLEKKYFDKFYELSTLMKTRTTFNELDNTVNMIVKLRASDNDYDFYLASPFFRPDQVEREERVKEQLRSLGYRVFSPKEACFLPGNAELSSRESVFNSNCEAIRKSKVVFAITDTKDMGTIWEAGYAFGINKPILYYAETLGDNPFNLMLAQSGVEVFTAFNELNRDNIDDVLYGNKTKAYGGIIE